MLACPNDAVMAWLGTCWRDAKTASTQIRLPTPPLPPESLTLRDRSPPLAHPVPAWRAGEAGAAATACMDHARPRAFAQNCFGEWGQPFTFHSRMLAKVAGGEQGFKELDL